MYKLIATDIYTAWSFTNALTDDLGAAADTTSQYKVGAGGTWTDITTPITVAANSAGTEEVFVRTDVNFNTVEGTTAQTLTLTLSDVKDSNDTPVTIITNAADVDITGTPVQTQTAAARPATSGIGSN